MRHLMLAAVLLLSLSSAWAAPDPLAAALTANEVKILNALKANDAKTFTSMVAGDGWSVDLNGSSAMKDFIPMIKDMKFESYKMRDVKVVSLSKDAALLTYTLDEKGSMQGEAFPPVVYATTAYANRGGKWIAIFHQETPPAPKK